MYCFQRQLYGGVWSVEVGLGNQQIFVKHVGVGFISNVATFLQINRCADTETLFWTLWTCANHSESSFWRDDIPFDEWFL